MSAVQKDSATGTVLTSRQGILLAQPSNFCTSFLLLSNGSQSDVLALFDQQSKELKDIASIIRGLPDEQRQQALNAGRIYLCGVK